MAVSAHVGGHLLARSDVLLFQVAAEVNYLISVQHEVLQSGHPELAVTSDSKLYAAAMIRLPNGELTFDPDRLPMLMISNQAKGLHYQVVAIPRPEIVCIIFKGRDQDEKGTPLYLVKKVIDGGRAVFVAE